MSVVGFTLEFRDGSQEYLKLEEKKSFDSAVSTRSPNLNSMTNRNLAWVSGLTCQFGGKEASSCGVLFHDRSSQRATRVPMEKGATPPFSCEFSPLS